MQDLELVASSDPTCLIAAPGDNIAKNPPFSHELNCTASHNLPFILYLFFVIAAPPKFLATKSVLQITSFTVDAISIPHEHQEEVHFLARAQSRRVASVRVGNFIRVAVPDNNTLSTIRASHKQLVV